MAARRPSSRDRHGRLLRPDGGMGGRRDRRAVDAVPGIRRPGRACAASSRAWRAWVDRSPRAAGRPAVERRLPVRRLARSDAPADRPAGRADRPGDRRDRLLRPVCADRRRCRRSLGRDADAARYGALADEVRAAFHREYVARSGRVVSDSATAYALALAFDLIRDPRRNAGTPPTGSRRSSRRTGTGSRRASSAPR